jgi:hypothetical protein
MFRRLPPAGGDSRATAEIVNNIMDGKTNNTGSFEVSTATVPLTVGDLRCGADSVVLLSPTNSRASQLMNHVFISSVANGSFVIDLRGGHSGSGTANFSYILVG